MTKLDNPMLLLLIVFVIFFLVGAIAIFYFSQIDEANPVLAPRVPVPSPATPKSPSQAPAPTLATPSPPSTSGRSPPRIEVENCFSVSTVSANNINKIIDSYNLEKTYMPLKMTYSLLLCTYNDILNESCANIRANLNKLILLGGSPTSPSGLTQLSYYTNIVNLPSWTKDFLVAAMDIISNYMALLINESAISEQERRQLRGFNYEFLRNYIDPIMKSCGPPTPSLSPV